MNKSSMSIHQLYKHLPARSHWKPQVIRVYSVIYTILIVCSQKDILFILRLVLLCVNLNVVRVTVGSTTTCQSTSQYQNLLGTIWCVAR